MNLFLSLVITFSFFSAELGLYAQNSFVIQHYDSFGNELNPNVSENSKMVWTVSKDGKILHMRRYDTEDSGAISWEKDRDIFSVETTDKGLIYTVSDNEGGSLKVEFLNPSLYTKKVKTIYSDGGMMVYTGNIDYSSLF